MSFFSSFFIKCAQPEISPDNSPPPPPVKMDPLAKQLRNLILVVSGNLTLLNIDLKTNETATKPTETRASQRIERTIGKLKALIHRSEVVLECLQCLLLSVPLVEVNSIHPKIASIESLVICDPENVLKHTEEFVRVFLPENESAAAASESPSPTE